MSVNHHFFSKPNWTVTGNNVPYPEKTNNLQHEVELVLALGKDANIFGIAVGVDLREEISKLKRSV